MSEAVKADVHVHDFLKNRNDDEIMNESHWKWQYAVKKGNDDNDVSEEMETVSKNTIKNATFLFFYSNRNMVFWGEICYLVFFDLTINGKKE